MDHQMQMIFAPLIPVLAARNFQSADLFELIGQFVETSPRIAQAMAFHARDILMEATPPATHSAHVTEVYRRTFFDKEYAQKYGTSDMLEKGIETMRSFVEYLISSFQMDDIQMAANSEMLPPSSQSH
jgi:hypothetical protein